MKWFKHDSDGYKSEGLTTLVSRLGMAALGRWYILLEVVASKMDETDRCHIEYPLNWWCETFRCTPSDLLCWLSTCERFCKIEVEVGPELLGSYSEVASKLNSSCSKVTLKLRADSVRVKGELIKISVPNLLKKRDKYTSFVGREKVESSPQIKSKDIRVKSKEIREDTPNGVSNARIAHAQALVEIWNLEKLESWPIVNFDSMKPKPKKTLSDRLWVASRNEDFDLKQIIQKAAEVNFLQTGRFFNLLWLVTQSSKYNELNYKQVLNGTYTNSKPSAIGKQRAGHLTTTGHDF